MAYMLARVELRSTLADNDVAWDDMLVCIASVSNRGLRVREDDGPENFLIPNRFPGDPPWFLTVPPARFVAVLTDPRPVPSVVSRRGDEKRG